MEKFKVIGAVVINEVVHNAGEIIELDPAAEQTKTWLEAKYIEPHIEPLPPVMVDYIVVKGPVAKPEGGEQYQTGNVIQYPENDEVASGMVAAGLIMLKSEHDKLSKEPAPVQQQEVPTTPAVAGSTEPRARYRGQIVLAESTRVVGVQSFHHIRIEDGSELDLTDLEYRTEVKVSYPPQA